MKQLYVDFRFHSATLKLIEKINATIRRYQQMGFKLTVRQLYYQLVTENIIPNEEKSYKHVTKVVNDGRLAGLIDWDMIEDRTRSFISRTRWENPSQILEAAAGSFHMDRWENQDYRVFCIVEKEALTNVLEGVCAKYDVPLLAARGYPSASVLRDFAVRALMPAKASHLVRILHLGDHDPSGLDMTRDLTERLQLFAEDHGKEIEVERLALNMDQINHHKPPPNPAKTTDSRFSLYRKLHGDNSWELDALNPKVISDLVGKRIEQLVDWDAWQASEDVIENHRSRLYKLAANYEE